MDLKQNWLGFMLLLVVKLSAAQWQDQRRLRAPAKLNSNQLVDKVSPGLSTQRPRPISQPAQVPPGFQFQNPVQSSVNVQSHQVLQGVVKPLNWRFPVVPQVPRPQPVAFDRPAPVSVRTVAAECTENAVHVQVKKDLFGTGEAIDVPALTLGGCAAKGEDPALQVLVFESELQGCNSNLIMTEDELVYVFTLIYGSPETRPNSLPIVRTIAAAGAVVLIECHYARLHNISSDALFPVWVPYASSQVAEEMLVFTLRLMMDDWISERVSNLYYLGEIINIEASVMQYNHVPLRVYVDSCVATAVPNLNAVPRYVFIENYGCLVDAKLTGSRSRFMPQTRGDKLAFQLEAFRFSQVNSNVIYIACLLRATAATFTSSAEYKACSFSNNGWIAAYGDSRVCECCETSCSARKGRDLSDQGVMGKVTLGPIVVETAW